MLLALSAAACAVMDPIGDVRPSPAELDVGPSGAGQALEWRLMRMRNENGRIAADARRVALRQRDANLDHWDGIDDGGIGNLNWIERGPDNLGGRSRALLVDPRDSSRLYAASAGGGIWRSLNGGNSWLPLDEFMGNLAVSSLAFDPVDPDIIYAGTGEGFGNDDAIFGAGIWRTVDAGVTWSQMPTTSGFGNINRIAVSQVDRDVLLIATGAGIRRSDDGGTSWSIVRSGRSLQVLIDPNNANRCVAHSSTTFAGNTTHSIVWSIDGGQTWTPATGGFSPGSRIELAYASSVNNRVYAVIAGFQCWRSDDGGQTWTQRTTAPIPQASFPWYCNSIWVDPTNSNWVVVGNVGVHRSSDGGQTFTTIGDGGIDTAHPHSDVHGFVPTPLYDGRGNRRIYVCTDGGIWRTNDIRTVTQAVGWERLDRGFRTVQYYGVAGHANGRLVGGTQDNGTHLIQLQSGNAATITYGNDGGNSQIDPVDPDYVYGEWQNLRVVRSTDGGQTALSMQLGLLDAGNCTNFIAPLVLSTADPNYLFAGGCSVWRCSDANGVLPVWGSIRGPIGEEVSALATAPSDVDVLWVGYNDGRVFRTANATARTPTWIAVDNNGTLDPFPDRFVTRILIDRTDPTAAFVAFGGFSSTNLWRTSNNGTTWQNAMGSGVTGLPDAPIYGLAQHPSLTGRYYAATEVGIFGTSDDCANWSTSNRGPADVSCNDVTFLHGSTTLLLGTHGRGMWTSTIFEPEVRSIGPGCAGTAGVPALAATSPRLGGTAAVSASGIVPGQSVWLVQGQSNASWYGSTLPADLTMFQAPGCFLRVRPDIVRDGRASATGDYSVELPILAHTALLGQRFYLQLFPADLAANGFGRTASNALELTIGN